MCKACKIDGKTSRHPGRPSNNTTRKIDSRGYIQVRDYTHPNAYRWGWVLEHRLVVENHLGRLLEPWEDVHHLDGDKTNNAIENLQLTSRSEHLKLHYPKGVPVA